MVESTKWHEVQGNVLGLCTWLAGESVITNCVDIIAIFEKPWNWDREYHLWQLAQTLGPEGAELCVVAVMEDKTVDDVKAALERQVEL